MDQEKLTRVNFKRILILIGGLASLSAIFVLYHSIHSPVRVTFSFDDGNSDHYNIGASILEKYGFRGTFNIITDKVGDPGYVTWDDVRNLIRRGHDIGSHTCSHTNLLAALSIGATNEIRRQIMESRDIINREVRKGVPGFSVALLYPPYILHNDWIDREIRDAGLEPMVYPRWNFGNRSKGDVCDYGVWMTTDEFLAKQVSLLASDIDIMCHGMRREYGWEPFDTVEDYDRHVRTVASYRDRGLVRVILERERTPMSLATKIRTVLRKVARKVLTFCR